MYAGKSFYGEKESLMKFVIFSHAVHCQNDGKIYSYGPFVKEMNLWITHFEKVIIVAPLLSGEPSVIDSAYIHDDISLEVIPALHYKGSGILKNVSDSLKVFKSCYKLMKVANHIHLRCPGNTGMLAMMVASLFPRKTKTVKYAGNWEPDSNQPISYRLQKWWLSSTLLIQNAKVLVYGSWASQNDHIIPFFTASFSELEKTKSEKSFDSAFRFIFCGSLSEGKQPLYAVKLITKLHDLGYPVSLELFGKGEREESIRKFIDEKCLGGFIRLMGNQSQENLKKAYHNSHFCILPSKSEGWPKALAEGMFFGCIPVGTAISCVPWMLGNGTRGLLISPENDHVENAVTKIASLMKNPAGMRQMSKEAQEWSQQYTLEKFAAEIKKLV